MRLRSFIVAYVLVLAFLLMAVRRPTPRPQNHYSHVVDLTDPTPAKANSETRSGTRIISPAALIPGTWGAAQIPAERLIAPLVVMDLKASSAQISVADIANWEALHGYVPQGAIIAVRRVGSAHSSSSDQFPVSSDAGQFLMDARCTRGFIVETPEASLAFTGDHRWHGFHPEVTERFAEVARGVRVLLQEAVSLSWEPPPAEAAVEEDGRLGPDAAEEDVAGAFGDVLDGARGLVVVNLYPMNRLRVHAFGAACAARGRVLVLERQAAAMADWPLVLEDVGAVLHDPRRYCVQLEFASLPTLIDLRPPAGSIYVHSNGAPLGPYDPAYRVMEAWVRALGLEFVTLGSGGHSRPADVRRMVELVAPAVVLPVHTRRPEALLVPGVPTLLPEVGRRYTPADLVPPP